MGYLDAGIRFIFTKDYITETKTIIKGTKCNILNGVVVIDNDNEFLFDVDSGNAREYGEIINNVSKGVKTIQAFDSNYYKFGDAFQLISKSSGKVKNAILLYCEDSRLIFSVVGYASDSNSRIAKDLYLKLEDLETTEVKKLIPESK
ncbi:hypothetical protein ACSW8L_15445 (plasmid) [Clostridium perfringens]